ncbi:MAG: HRDC domain-containing protein [Verrucomicrobia bacterium]|nr:HRDC domain-containing protein [Verrucomicrobiota bacterium]
MPDSFKMVTTLAGLRETAARIKGEPCVALDTEFVWNRTYYARLGLIQLALADGSCFLLDPIAVTDLTPLGEILADSSITKILHDAQQDLMHLKRATGVPTCNIFDTRLAMGFSGLDSTLSLSSLLAELLDIQLPKEHTRADWVARPLQSAYLEYAADDVRHLPRVAALLRERARDAGVEAWLDEELATLDASALYDEMPLDEAYLRIRAAASLSPRKLAVLRELAAWREQKARDTNRPRRWVVEDHELMSVALTLAQSHNDLRRCRRLEAATIKSYGDDLLAAVQRGMSIAGDALPPPVFRPSRDATQRGAIDDALKLIKNRAMGHKICPQIVSSRAQIALLLEGGPAGRPEHHPLLNGWRSEFLGDALTAITAPKATRPAMVDRQLDLGV